MNVVALKKGGLLSCQKRGEGEHVKALHVMALRGHDCSSKSVGCF